MVVELLSHVLSGCPKLEPLTVTIGAWGAALLGPYWGYPVLKECDVTYHSLWNGPFDVRVYRSIAYP